MRCYYFPLLVVLLPDQFDPSVTVALSGGVVTLRGLVPDDGSYRRIVDAAGLQDVVR